MQCPTCGYANPDDARICRGCGRELYTACPECGAENTADRTYCANCGVQMQEAPEGGMTAAGVPVAFEADRPAGFWIRLLASLIDSIPLTLISALLAWLIFGENYLGSFVLQFETNDAGELVQTNEGSPGGQVINLILSGIYATALVSLLGGTVGVLLLRMRIVRPDGSLLGPGRAFARYVVLTLSFLLLLVPAIVSAFMVGLRSDRRGIHDLLCDTVVVIKS